MTASVRVNTWESLLKKLRFGIRFKIKLEDAYYTFHVDEPYMISYEKWMTLVDQDDAVIKFAGRSPLYIRKSNRRYTFVAGTGDASDNGMSEFSCDAGLIEDELEKCIKMLHVGGFLP